MKRTNAEVIAALEQVVKRLDVYNDQLKEHMARTLLLEAAIESQRKHFEYRHEEADERNIRHEAQVADRMNKQEAQINGLPAKAVHYVSILSGIAALIKLLF